MFDVIRQISPQARPHGATASFGQNQYQTGADWAKELVVPVLLGRDPGALVPVAYHAYDLQLNTAAAAAAGVTVRPELVKAAARVSAPKGTTIETSRRADLVMTATNQESASDRSH